MARAHWRDPQGQFALNQRAYVPVWPVSDGSVRAYVRMRPEATVRCAEAIRQQLGVKRTCLVGLKRRN